MAESGGTKGSMQSGMTKSSPAAVDSSMTPPKGSVDSDTTRSGVAPTPKTLGPRTA